MKLKLVGTDGLVSRILVLCVLGTIAFWLYLFTWAPRNLEFATGKYQMQFLTKPRNARVIFYDFNSSTHWLSGVELISKAKQTQKKAGQLLTGFGVAGLLLFLLLARKVKKTNHVWLFMGIYIISFLLAKVFYNTTFRPFDDDITYFEKSFVLIKSLPFMAGFYLLVRRWLGAVKTKLPVQARPAVFASPVFRGTCAIGALLIGLIIGSQVHWLKLF